MEGQRTKCPCLVCAYDLDGVSIYRQRNWERRGRSTHGCCRRLMVWWWMVISTSAVAVDCCFPPRDCCFSPIIQSPDMLKLNDLRHDGRFDCPKTSSSSEDHSRFIVPSQSTAEQCLSPTNLQSQTWLIKSAAKESLSGINPFYPIELTLL